MTLAQDLRSNVLRVPNTGAPEPLRHYCPNVRCGARLKRPTRNPRDAFCCAGCFRSYYRGRCLVCERPFKRKTERRQVCDRSQCRHEFQRHRERFEGARYPTSGLGHNGVRSANKTGLKIDDRDGRAFRLVAGPDLSAVGFRLATLPPYSHLPRPALIRRHSSPLNVLGGYRFSDAPRVPRIYVNWFAGKRGRNA